ncbi:hypothetical protein KKA93_03295 [Patescibacteria group bacterium]|nr:hypothetical protein [Patescibacteria group bacterium]MBU1663046.1 hypothetical protein [Patescibacteria group bacterium]MBU1934114.1 hypothetical protein [Patescibacteria group bacterium]MBU2007917.1 hypothetical protein [Patescibacteria group bacterium]MBU2233527.1 hypothetical protein [Patescibacteria group bacterium]
MDIVISLQPILDFLDLPTGQILVKLFYYIGLIPISITFLYGVSQVWLRYIRLAYAASEKTVLLAIDVPRGNAQTPMAVENIFAYLAGAHSTPDLFKKWWLGESQLYFSFEIVSINGYIQFLVWLPEKYCNLAETAIYSQYPDAEITEVNDYTQGLPDNFPDEEYDIFGGEYILTQNSVYPIKTYKHFEHQMGEPETQYKDPMAALMDLMGSIKKGEQLWYQILVIPIANDWADKGEDEIKKIIGEKVESDNLIDKFINGTISLIEFFSEMIHSLWADIETAKSEEKEPQFKMMNLKPRQKKQVEEIQEKVGKLGFGVKIRYLYIAQKEVMNKNKVGSGFTGYMKQFNFNDLNSYKPDKGDGGTFTNVSYEIIFGNYRVNLRKNKLMMAYKFRSDARGRKPHILNTEELASIWHFPVEASVKAPLLQRVSGRKVESPSNLPVSVESTSKDLESGFNVKVENIFASIDKADKNNFNGKVKNSPPANLPVV